MNRTPFWQRGLPIALALGLTGPTAALANGPQDGGSGSIWLGFATYSLVEDFDGQSDRPRDSWRGGINGQYTFAINPENALRFDAYLEGDLKNDNDEDHMTEEPRGFAHAGVHWNYFTDPMTLFGAYAGYGVAYVTDEPDERGYQVGLEAAALRGDTAYFGQIGYYDSISPDDTEVLDSAIYGRFGAAYYMDNNSRVSGSILIGGGDSHDTQPVTDMQFVGLDLIYRRSIPNRGMDWYVGYEGFYMTNQEGGENERILESALVAGITFSFGGGGSNRSVNRAAFADLLTTPRTLHQAAGFSVDVVD